MKNPVMKIVEEGLTYDDVLLVPAYSEILPRDTDISTNFSRNIRINIPIVSAAMDTVTEATLAIAMAQEGGIGVLHKNMSIAAQASEVRKVKRSESGMIHDPVTLNENATIGEALAIMKEQKIGGIPIVNAKNILVGILTNRDLRFEKQISRKVKDVMTRENLITVTGITNLQKAEVILQDYKIEKLPVIDKQGRLIGLITYKDIIKYKSRPNSCKDSLGRLRVAAAVGVTADVIERVSALVGAGVDAIVIDTAHGHSVQVSRAVERIKRLSNPVQVIAGNVGTAAGAKALAEAGMDVISGDYEGKKRKDRRTLAVLAPTNKAASVLRSHGVPATTIHRILYTPVYDPEYEKIAEWLAGNGERPVVEGLTDISLDRALAFYQTVASIPGALAAATAEAAAAGRGASFCSVLSCTCVVVPGLAEWHRLQFSTDQASSPLWQAPQNWPSMIFSMLIWLPPAWNWKPRSA